MKIKILTFVLTLAMFSTYAQVLKSIGIKGGMSISNQTFRYENYDETIKYDNLISFNSVFTTEFFKGKYLSMITDFGYVQKGMQEDIEEKTSAMPYGTGEFKTWKNILGYLTFSPMLKCFYNFNNFTTYALLGPRIDYRLELKTKNYNQLYNDANKRILGMNYGIGTSYRIGNYSILLDFIAQPDFTNIFFEEAFRTFSSLEVTGKSFVVNCGLNYHFR